MLDFTGITCTKILGKGNISTFEIGPLHRGYGHTMGNALRRVLLSSLKGAAISSVRINNITHEYTTIPGIKQNVLDIVLRLKSVRIKMDGDAAVAITLNKKGKGKVTAADLVVPNGVTVVNKDFEIAEITDGSASLSIEAIVEKGVGYKKADESMRDEIGRIPVDTIFGPVKLVEFTVLPTRKGARADFDKISLTITTDGTISPESALAEAGGILRNVATQLSIVFGSKDEATVEESDQTNMSNWNLSDIGVSAALLKKLKTAKVTTLSELASNSKVFYTKTVKLTAKQIESLEKLLKQYNLEFSNNA